MYLEHFGFREKPFNVTPDPRFFYANQVYQEAYAGLLYGIRERKGFLVLSGEVGTGKTTLLRKVMSSLEETIHFAFFYNTNLNFDEMLHFVCEDFGLTVAEEGRLAKIQALNTFLLERLQEGGTGVLFVDEAQNLADDVLEHLRLLSNLETASEKLLQIVLVGQPELEKKLSQPKLRQLKQRVAIQCKLGPLKEQEIGTFIQHRLQLVGYEGAELFSPDVVARIATYSHGIPRLINILCDNALLLAYSLSQSRVSAQMLEEAAHDLQLKGASKAEANKWATSLKASAEGQWSQEWNLAMPSRGFPSRPAFDGQPLQQAMTTSPGIDREIEEDNESQNFLVWPVEQRPRQFRRIAIGVAIVLLLVSGAVAATYPQKILAQFSDWGMSIDGIGRIVSERLASLRNERNKEDAVHSPQVSSQEEVQGVSQSVPSEKPTLSPQEQSALDSLQSDSSYKKEEQQKLEQLSALEGNSVQQTEVKKEELPASATEWKGQRIVVPRGMTLSTLVQQAYGNYNILAIDLIQELNPQIQNIDQIAEGTTLWLPSLSRETLLREQADGSYHLILGSFRSPSEAERFARRVRRKGYSVITAPRSVSDNVVFSRVEIESLRDPAAIERALSLVETDNVLPGLPGTTSTTARVNR